MTRATYLRWIAAAVAVLVIAVVGNAVIDWPSAPASPSFAEALLVARGSTGDAGDPIPPELSPAGWAATAPSSMAIVVRRSS